MPERFYRDRKPRKSLLSKEEEADANWNDHLKSVKEEFNLTDREISQTVNEKGEEIMTTILLNRSLDRTGFALEIKKLPPLEKAALLKIMTLIPEVFRELEEKEKRKPL